MLVEEQAVSRKTPLDGRLEISPAAAARLAGLGAHFTLVSGGREDSARLQSLSCTCGKRPDEAHLHHFLESPLLRRLSPGSSVRVELDEESSAVRVEPA